MFMVNYGINYTLAQVGATTWSRPFPAWVGATSCSWPYGDHVSKQSRPGGRSYQIRE